MSLLLVCTILQITCFQLCGLPSIVRMVRRKSSGDLSIWREVLLLCGIVCQLTAMALAKVHWLIVLSPIASFLSIATVLGLILWYRRSS